MTAPVQVRDRYTMPDQAGEWWGAVVQHAHAVLTLASGLRLFVADEFEEIVKHPSVSAFITVQLVSVSQPDGSVEFERFVSTPPLQRAYPLAHVRSIGAIPDAEQVAQVIAGRSVEGVSDGRHN